MSDSLKRNFKYALFAQIITVMVSFITGIILPKLISIEDFGYWQLFVFYCTCFEFSMLGIPNGFYLKYAGKLKISNSLIKKNFYVILFLSSAFAYLFYCCTNKVLNLYLAIAVLIINIGTYYSYVTQSFNKIQVNAIANIFLNTTIILGFNIAIILDFTDIKTYILIFILSHFCKTVFLIYANNKNLEEKVLLKINYFLQIRNLMKIGLMLLLIDYTNVLALGISRLMCENHFGIVLFSKLSLAISLILLVINFLNQVIISLLPGLRRLNKDVIKIYYQKGRILVLSISLFIFLFYEPAIKLFEIWLPNYFDSIVYIVLFLPYLIFESKMQIIFSLLFKVLRKEVALLKINIIYLCCVLINSYIFIFCYSDIEKMIISILVLSCIRSMLAELFLSKILNTMVSFTKIIIEITVSILFLSKQFYYSEIESFIYYVVIFFLILYSVKQYKNLNDIIVRS